MFFNEAVICEYRALQAAGPDCADLLVPTASALFNLASALVHRFRDDYVTDLRTQPLIIAVCAALEQFTEPASLDARQRALRKAVRLSALVPDTPPPGRPDLTTRWSPDQAEATRRSLLRGRPKSPFAATTVGSTCADCASAPTTRRTSAGSQSLRQAPRRRAGLSKRRRFAEGTWFHAAARCRSRSAVTVRRVPSEGVALAPATWPRPLQRVVRTFNKYMLNSLMRPRAGRKNSYAAAIRHTGRKSGTQYTTPVGAQRIPNGFIIPLAFGTHVDWLQNVFAAGTATLSANGETHDVTEPELIDASTALPMISPQQRRAYERVGISQYLKVKLTESH